MYKDELKNYTVFYHKYYVSLMGIGGVSLAAAGENFDEFESWNAIS